jgi:hypothetical protein
MTNVHVAVLSDDQARLEEIPRFNCARSRGAPNRDASGL